MKSATDNKHSKISFWKLLTQVPMLQFSLKLNILAIFITLHSWDVHCSISEMSEGVNA